jgi:hypothetical protein
MSGARSRNKGARGEREVIAILQPIVDKVTDECGQPRLVLRRNYSQRYEAKQYDVIGLPWVALEVKRVENLSGLGKWWRQVISCTGRGQVPVLIYRQNHGKWHVRTRVPVRAGGRVGGVHVVCTVTMDLATWLVWLEQRLKVELM